MSELVRAAGGIVFRSDAKGRQVALVHRPRYDDWTFPKGKLIDGEDDETAALREVEEETGLRCRIGRRVGAVTYLDSHGRPKVVRYFEMLPDGGVFVPTDEVDQLRWVPIGEAEGVLSYGHDRRMFRRALPEVSASVVYIVRHGKAGTRGRWEGPDEERPLTRRGRRQARRLVERFQGLDVERILSSPFVRCVQTVAPLGEARGLGVETIPELAEGTGLDDAVALLGSLDHRPTVMCGHGSEIQDLVERLEASGATVEGGRGIAKGSVWVLEREGRRVVSARYLPAPSG
ncbi:MAG TPA: NUDIX hydrolase [Actinomycetota bacterium]|nr:NUDIX hydrolase [Actinomycetota bacterium]